MDSITEIRTTAMLTQKEFADALGVNLTSVQHWEQGKANPSLRNKRKIVDFCKEYKIKYE